MAPLTLLLLATSLSPQADRRPTLTVTSENSNEIVIQASWTAMSVPGGGGGAFARHEWEARDAATLLGTGIIETTEVSFPVNRPRPGDTIRVRVFVRGVGERPGPWGWASHPLYLVNAVLNSDERQELAARVGADSVARSDPAPTPFPEDPPAQRADSVTTTISISVTTTDTPPDRPTPQERAPTLPEQPDEPLTEINSAPDSAAMPGGNQPSGFVPLIDGDLWRNISDTRNVRREQDDTAPLSPPSVIAITYPRGLASGSAPVSIDLIFQGMAGMTQLYIRYAFKLDREFHGHSSATNRLLNFSLGAINLFDFVSGAGLSPIQYQVGLEGTRPACQLAKPAPLARRLVPTLAAPLFIRGRWYTVELVVRPGTPGLCNGEVRAWMNGELIMSYDDVGLGRTGSDPFVFDRVSLDTRWGNTGLPLETQFTVWIDEIYLSGFPRPDGQSR